MAFDWKRTSSGSTTFNYTDFFSIHTQLISTQPHVQHANREHPRRRGTSSGVAQGLPGTSSTWGTSAARILGGYWWPTLLRALKCIFNSHYTDLNISPVKSFPCALNPLCPAPVVLPFLDVVDTCWFSEVYFERASQNSKAAHWKCFAFPHCCL